MWTVYEDNYPSIDREPEWLDEDFETKEDAEKYIAELYELGCKRRLYPVKCE